MAGLPKKVHTENGTCGVYFVMKRKFTAIGLCTLLALVVCFAFGSRSSRRRAAQATKSQLVVAPDGTISVPPNDYVTFVAEMPKPITNASPTNVPAGKK